MQDLLDGVMSQHQGRHPVPDRIAQWQESDREQAALDIAQSVVVARLGALLHDLCHVPFGHAIEDDLKVLMDHDANGPRFARLWRDLVDDLPSRLERHLPADAKLEAIMPSLQTLVSPDGALHRELRPLIISKDAYADELRKQGALRYPFAADLVGNTICADLLDYLLRDHLYTGLPVAIGHRFTSAFFVVPEGRGPYSQRVALNIVQDGYERTDVISELLKALRYRYELSERALYHHTKLAADVMIGKALDLWSQAVWLAEAAPVLGKLDRLEEFVDVLDYRGLRAAAVRALDDIAGAKRSSEDVAEPSVAGRQDDAARQRNVAAHAETSGTSSRDEGPESRRDDGTRTTIEGNDRQIADATFRNETQSQATSSSSEAEILTEAIGALDPDQASVTDLIVERQQERLEDEVLAHGDDGLLEYLASLADAPPSGGPGGPVIDALRRQAAALGQAVLDRELFVIGGRVGVDDAPAGKLYEEFGSIAPRTAAQDEAQRFAEIGREPRVLIWLPDPEMRLKLARVLVDNGAHVNEFQAYEEARGGRGADIYRAHRRLWSLWVFCDRSLTRQQREAVLVYLAAKFGVAWERMRGDYGADPGKWIVRHALSRLLEVEPLDYGVTGLLPMADEVAARGPALQTVSDVMAALSQIPEVADAVNTEGKSA